MTKLPPKPKSFPTVPGLTESLVKYLEATYPDKALDIALPLHEQHARFGEIRLVRSLRAAYDRQQKERAVG